jgi:serine/threonine protein kinase
MASPPPSQQESSSNWSGFFSTLGFWQSKEQHESSLQDQNDQFRISSVDPEPQPPIHRNISSTSVKINSKSELGKGAFARVYVGRFLDRDEECAIKVFNDKVLAEDVEKEFKRMHDLKHPNIVRVYGMIPAYKVSKGKNAFVIVMELCDMSLDQYIKERFRRGISKVKLLQILHDIASAMVYLHDQDMVHGDLRSPNVLIKESADSILAKVTDFGMTGCLNEAGELMTTTFADAKYLPPEVFMNNMPGCTKNWVKLSRKVDVFSYGPIAIELGCGEFPEPTAKAETKKKKVVRTFSEIQRRDKHIKKVKRVYSECIELIVKQCMQDRPEERASFSEILLTVEGFQHQCSTRPDSEWIDEKQHEIEQLRAQMEADQQAKEEYKRCNHLKWEEMESKQKTLEQNAEELKRLLGVKEQAMHELTEKARKQSEELETVQFTNMALKREVEDLHKLNAEANNKAQKVLIEKGQKLQVLEEQNRTLSQERDNFYEDCVSNNTKIQELEQKILEKDSQMEVLSHKKDMLISKLEIQCQDLHSEIEQKQKQFSERENGLKREVEEAKSALEERNRRVETLTV